MNRTQLEHILRAAAAITGTDRFVIVGSQAILGQFENPPPELLASVEADVYSPRSPDDSALIDGSIGEASPFHMTFGYYAHGVGEETAVLPAGWKDRLIPFHSPRTGGATGLCLEAHDLAVSKLVAGRDKDIEYIAALIRHGMVSGSTLEARLKSTKLEDALRKQCEARLHRAGA